MILTTLLAAAALYGGQTPVLVPDRTPQATAEGIEILRRLLVETLDMTFEVESKGQRIAMRERHSPGGSLGLVTTLWAGQGTVEHARAFHMPEAGLFFAFDLSLPVVAAEKKQTPGAGPGTGASGDEWERIRREMRGGIESGGQNFSYTLRFEPTAPNEIDPKAIEKVIDVALRVVARHASRIEGLDADDTATLALRLGGKSRSLMQNFEPEEAAATEVQPGLFSAYVLATGHDVRPQNLVIRVPLADLGSLADAPERLRQRAEINLY